MLLFTMVSKGESSVWLTDGARSEKEQTPVSLITLGSVLSQDTKWSAYP